MSMAFQYTEILLCQWPPQHKIPTISMALQTQKFYHVDGLPNTEILL
jgi:hypothetical protein